jgi:hypothetical protein
MERVRAKHTGVGTVLLKVLLSVNVAAAVWGFVSVEPASAQPAVDPPSAVQALVAALNQGDIDGVMATFAARAPIAYSGFGACQISTVCVGVDPIRRAMQSQLDQHETITITNLQVFGSVVIAQNERRNDFITCHGHERILTILVAEVVPSGIVSVSDLPDATDRQTVENGQIVGRNPQPPCIS